MHLIAHLALKHLPSSSSLILIELSLEASSLLIELSLDASSILIVLSLDATNRALTWSIIDDDFVFGILKKVSILVLDTF